MDHSDFHRITARHVSNDHGVEVEFIGRDMLRFSLPHSWIELPVDAHIADDGAPDGFIVRPTNLSVWSDGRHLTSQDIDLMRRYLELAAVPLLTKLSIDPLP